MEKYKVNYFSELILYDKIGLLLIWKGSIIGDLGGAKILG